MKPVNTLMGQDAPGEKIQLERMSQGESPLRQVFRSEDLRKVMPGLVISALISNVLAVALPLALLQIMDRVVHNKSLDTLVFLVIGIIIALVLEEILRSLNGLVTAWLGARFEHNATVTALDRLMRVPMQRYQREEPGAYAEKILSAGKVADYYSGHALLFLLDLPFVLIFLAAICIIGGWLVLVPIVLLLIFGYLMARYALWIRERIYQRHVIDDRRFNFLAEVLSNIRSVKLLTMEALMQRRYERLQESNANMVETLTQGNMMAANMRNLFSQIMVTTIIFAGVWVVIPGAMTPGALAACMLLSLRALHPLLRTLSAWLSYQSFLDAHGRLSEVMEMPCEEDQGKPALPPVIDSLVLRNITICHEGGTPLFSDLSLSVRAGQCIAIRGESGSGKSTLLSLLNNLSQPDSGSVLVDGRSIQEFDAESLHKEIALLPQTGAVIAGTILENLTMFDDSLNQAALLIAEKLGLDQVVAGMKLGYETRLCEGVADVLPDGVRQIITIIRAMVRNPSAILFDEANIALDMGSDKLLREYLASLKGKCTMVLVTHRPSLLSLADQVFDLVGGRLTEGERNVEFAADINLAAITAVVMPERPKHIENLPLIISRQFEEESDFSVCLLPLLNALKWKGRPRELAEAMPHMIPRLDLSGLCSVMSNLDLLPQHIPGSLGRLDHRLLPCLFVSANKHARVILERLDDGRLKVFDSETREVVEIGMMEMLLERGELYLFRKPEKDVKKGRFESTWFGSLFWGFRKHIALAFALTVISTLLTLAPPLFVMSVYNSILPTGDVVMGSFLLFGVFIAIGIDWFMRQLKGKIMAYMGGRVEYILGASMFQRIIGLPTASTEGASVSHQVGRIKGLEGLREFFLGPMATLFFDFPAILIMLGVIAYVNQWLALVVLVSGLVYSLLGLLTRTITKKAVARFSHLSSQSWDFLNEALINMRTIRSVGARRLWISKFRELSAKSTMASFHNQKVQSRINSITHVMGTITGLLTVSVAAILTIQGKLTGGGIISTMMLVWRVTGPIQNIFLSAAALVRIKGTMSQIENLMRLKGERDGGVQQTIRPEMHGEIAFSRVSFRYATDADPALLGVTFTIRTGQVVAITGPNGTGKSTLLKLIARVYMPQAGTVRMDNIDTRQLSIADLRSRISYMPQSVEIFYGSVMQNLLLADPTATDEEVKWAVEMAGMTDEIQALPQGYETRISNSKSEQLPQGFRQRLSLARTILKPASVVLLDEPGAGMDQAGEAALIRCIKYLRGRATVIIVTHRPAHMRLADTVVCMNHGAVTAIGSFEQVTDTVMAGLR